MFRGVNPLTLDSKGRLAVPARYREELARRCSGQMIVTVDMDSCLLLYPLPGWLEIESKLAGLSAFNDATRRLQRLLIGHATECDLDGAGRILLPPKLREYAGLDKSVVLLGQGNRFEIWDESRWDAHRTTWLEQGLSADQLPPELSGFSL